LGDHSPIQCVPVWLQAMRQWAGRGASLRQELEQCLPASIDCEAGVTSQQGQLEILAALASNVRARGHV
jgi:hypothetical protein